jgi:23S rRNA pseudouridine1911/1915/1917 synthase
MTNHYTIDQEQEHKRADIVAAELLPKLSRAYVKTLFTNGHITVNAAPAKPGQKLRAGNIMTITFDPSTMQQIENIELPIIYEDKDVIVIDKPTGVISHSRGRYWYEPSVASFVRQITGQEGERSGIVHRLDRDTSGVMICAKNAEALSILQKQFSSRKVHKTYRAIVSGHVAQEHAIIDMPIERNPKKPQTFRVGANGKQAQTEYQVIMTLNSHDKLELKPLTGRTHQLRVHLRQLGHPIVGDSLYGIEAAERLFLHAYSIELTLPNGQRASFMAEEPKAFREFEVAHA